MQPVPDSPKPIALREAFFHADSSAVRFWVHDPAGEAVGAIIRQQILHHRFQADVSGSDALAVYTRHRAEIDAAVLRRIATGSIEPVLLREADFTPPAGAADLATPSDVDKVTSGP
jgi:hypothetical protein